ncbi:uncharacterized protein LOC135847429 [Planococcus citri]|uniref:uncharacterized protein LOC135847429 n=1 Tax=Planococcus citri TaxID=170843 RepID=UPI0031F83025
MSQINEDTLLSILASKHHDYISSIRILDWHINDKIVKEGTNYSTQVSRLTIRYHPQSEHDANIPPREETFFLKVPSNSVFYDLIKQWGSYDNEVAIYTKVLPAMYTIENDDHKGNCSFTSKHYFSDDRMSLVLEDLSQSGYRCADRLDQLDIEHCFYALRCLAKFHALSVKLETTVGLPELVKRDAFMSPDGMSDPSITAFQSHIPMYLDSLPQNLKDRYPNMVEYFQTLTSAENLTLTANRLTTSKFNVLCHGDFWTNNIMFEYDKYDTIREVKLIDFQLTSWSNPAKDLIYFIITSVKFELYLKYFPLLLRIYLDTLNRVLSRLECPTYHMNQLLDDLDTMYPLAPLILCTALPLITSDPDDPIDTKEMSKDDKYESKSMAKAFKHKRFREISAMWFEHLAQKGTMRIDE